MLKRSFSPRLLLICASLCTTPTHNNVDYIQELRDIQKHIHTGNQKLKEMNGTIMTSAAIGFIFAPTFDPILAANEIENVRTLLAAYEKKKQIKKQLDEAAPTSPARAATVQLYEKVSEYTELCAEIYRKTRQAQSINQVYLNAHLLGPMRELIVNNAQNIIPACINNHNLDPSTLHNRAPWLKLSLSLLRSITWCIRMYYALQARRDANIARARQYRIATLMSELYTIAYHLLMHGLEKQHLLKLLIRAAAAASLCATTEYTHPEAYIDFFTKRGYSSSRRTIVYDREILGYRIVWDGRITRREPIYQNHAVMDYLLHSQNIHEREPILLSDGSHDWLMPLANNPTQTITPIILDRLTRTQSIPPSDGTRRHLPETVYRHGVELRSRHLTTDRLARLAGRDRAIMFDSLDAYNPPEAPSSRVVTHDKPELLDDWLCSICRENKATQFTTLACQHTFCSACIKTWRDMNPTCPNCRRTIEVANVYPQLTTT